jgi:small subunit ribosomal protein S20
LRRFRAGRRGFLRVRQALTGGDPACITRRLKSTENRTYSMAHHKSAEKRLRQTAKRTAINRARAGAVKSAMKRVETAIASGKKADAEAALKAAQPELHSGVSKGVLHKNAAARKISRLTKRIRAL